MLPLCNYHVFNLHASKNFLFIMIIVTLKFIYCVNYEIILIFPFN